MQKMLITLILILMTNTLYAATAIELKNKPISILKPYVLHKEGLGLAKLHYYVDGNDVTHMVLQETFDGFSVWDVAFDLNIPADESKKLSELVNNPNSKATMDGYIYGNLQQDLDGRPDYIFNYSYAQVLVKKVRRVFEEQNGRLHISKVRSDVVVFVFEGVAHWSYLITLEVKPQNQEMYRTQYIIDALNYKIYYSADLDF